jgi:hypothetical protein
MHWSAANALPATEYWYAKVTHEGAKEMLRKFICTHWAGTLMNTCRLRARQNR